MGIILPFLEGREVARKLSGINTEESYLDLMKNRYERIDNDENLAHRLPYRPDIYYKNEWISWEDFLCDDS